jgi:hypothetical protein
MIKRFCDRCDEMLTGEIFIVNVKINQTPLGEKELCPRCKTELAEWMEPIPKMMGGE